MAGPFRFAPPHLGPGTISRPRLLRRLQQRWTHPVTLVIGGPGFGKTTLLAQAVAETVLDQRGHDIWIGLDPDDADGGFGGDLLAAILGRTGDTSPRAEALAEACWQLAPSPVCVILDDGHHLIAGGDGHRLVSDLVPRLPANAHLVVAARTDPQLPTARMAATSQLLRLAEDELGFDDAELEAIARDRGLEPDRFEGTGGWPAMVELAATAGRTVAREFLWQEVIQPLPASRRRVLAAIVALGGGDDALLSAALDDEVALRDALAGIPLIAVSDDGWHRPHPLWQPIARLRLADAELAGVRRRAVHHLIQRARFDDVFRLIDRMGASEHLPDLFRAACIEFTRHPPARSLRRWLAAVPADASPSPAVALGAGVLAALDDPDHASPALRAAVAGFRAVDDLAGELGAISHLGRVAWWTRDLEALGELAPRVDELAATGHPAAVGFAAVGRAIMADLDGDDAAMLAALTPLRPGQLGPAWEPALAWMRSVAYHGLGDLDAAQAINEAALDSIDDVMFRDVLEGQHSAVRWALGLELDQRPDDGWHTQPWGADRGGVQHNITVAVANQAFRRAHVGDLATARLLLDRARSHPAGDRPIAVARLAVAEAAASLAEGDEATATATLRAALDDHPLASSARRAWRDAMALTYVLLPEARAAWDDLDLPGRWSYARDLAAAVVAVRDGATLDDHLARIRLDDLDTIRVHLHHRFAAELAAGVHNAGDPRAADLLEALGPPGRAQLRQVATQSDHPQAAAAKGLLGSLPAVPAEVVRVGLLGPVDLHHGSVRSDHPALRRERVRALLTLLALRGRATRAEIIDALWPDFDERAGANNLRVTLNHLHRALEPERAEAEPPYFVRSHGGVLQLIRDGLHLDVAELDRHVASAERAECDGVPSVALEHHLAAVALWRGELAGDVNDAAWLDLERERVRLGYLRALRRAGQLQLARSEHDAAESLGRRALALDPYDEDAHGVLVGVALARGDQPAARRLLATARDALAELGIEPGRELRRLAAATT